MAGTLTTAWVLEVTTYHLLTTPPILSKLKAELTAAIPSPNDIGSIPLPTLESLTYLTAVMKEGLRLSYGTSCRLARIDPDNAVTFRDKGSGREYVIPAGTPMGMTSVQIHHDESLFPDSWTFNPERWLDGKNKGIDKYLVAFTAGSRQCMGINLAQAELYLSLSAIWRVWGSRDVRGADDVGWFELFETGKRDVEIESDAFLPIVQKGSQGIRLKAYS
jgi:cytochrome P450